MVGSGLMSNLRTLSGSPKTVERVQRPSLTISKDAFTGSLFGTKRPRCETNTLMWNVGIPTAMLISAKSQHLPLSSSFCYTNEIPDAVNFMKKSWFWLSWRLKVHGWKSPSYLSSDFGVLTGRIPRWHNHLTREHACLCMDKWFPSLFLSRCNNSITELCLGGLI